MTYSNPEHIQAERSDMRDYLSAIKIPSTSEVQTNQNEKGGIRMEKKTKKPTTGTWGRLPMQKGDLPPRVSFDINIPEVVTFMEDEPTEREGEDGVYYSFEVNHNGLNTVLQTSAWTLLSELKKNSPLKSKTLKITKLMEKGKQYFLVENA